MKPPFLKKIASHFHEFHIESAPSEINPHLYVSLTNGRYQLCTANAVYSYGDLYSNFAKSFDQLRPFLKDKMNVLVLGFGLGSIPFMLERNFKKRMYYTGVELDENVIYLAEKYVLDELQSPIQMICADALVFVAQSMDKYDLICMDVFLDDIVPYEFRKAEYLEDLKNLLEPNGLILYNRLALSDNDKQTTKWFYEETFKSIFPEGDYLDVGGNWMLMNRKLE